VRPEAELPGCSGRPPSEDPNSALFRIEVIRVPLANPEQAAIVTSPRIFDDLAAPPRHGLTPVEREAIEQAQARGEFILEVMGETIPVPVQVSSMMLDSIMRGRGGTGTPTAEDSATLRRDLTAMIEESIADQIGGGPTQCHDITVYPAIGLAGGACEGYGLLLDIRDPIDPKRIAAVADSNFAYWHSATFNNDGSAILFTDEWGGGGGARCRATDPIEWGANAIYSIEGGELRFRSYYKLPAPQTDQENCVAHNGSLIPIPGRDVKVQAWYQGGVSVFDWTDPANPFEIAFHDRGPVHPTRMESAGSWSAYWYNGVIVSSEIARGLDIFELEPSEFISRNELDAAKSVRLEYLNPQGQPRFEWPASIALAGAYLDQLERSGAMSAERIGNARQRLAASESSAGVDRVEMLTGLAAELQGEAARSTDGPKVELLVGTLRELASEAATD
jgi:hypothetical protein